MEIIPLTPMLDLLLWNTWHDEISIDKYQDPYHELTSMIAHKAMDLFWILAVNPCGNALCKVEQNSVEYCAYPDHVTACDCGTTFDEICDSEYSAI